MGIKDLREKITLHAQVDVTITDLAGLTIAIDASPFVIKAWYNDVPSFKRRGATRTHSYRAHLSRLINGFISAGATILMARASMDARCSSSGCTAHPRTSDG